MNDPVPCDCPFAARRCPNEQYVPPDSALRQHLSAPARQQPKELLTRFQLGPGFRLTPRAYYYRRPSNCSDLDSVLLGVEFALHATACALDPFGIGLVPLDPLAQACLPRCTLTPAQLSLNHL